MASFDLLFGILLMFTPPVGRCSALVLGGVFYAYLLFNKKNGKCFCILYDRYIYKRKGKYFCVLYFFENNNFLTKVLQVTNRWNQNDIVATQPPRQRRHFDVCVFARIKLIYKVDVSGIRKLTFRKRLTCENSWIQYIYVIPGKWLPGSCPNEVWIDNIVWDSGLKCL